ncbi:hypothetical protein J7J62_07725 [bacterium]|nr:hypothetical protein [bacterium]
MKDSIRINGKEVPISVARQLCDKNIRIFISVCFKHKIYKPLSPCHDAILDVFQNEVGKRKKIRKVIIAPRGHGKTTLDEIVILWLICTRRKRYCFLLRASDTLAEQNLLSIKDELENNPYLTLIYPEVVGIGPIWRGNFIVTNNNAAISARGAGAKVKGSKYLNYRPDMIIIDDICSREDVLSKSRNKEIYEWFTRDVMKAGDDNTDIVTTGTLMGKEHILYKLMTSKEFASWESVKFKSIIKWPERMDLWDAWAEIYTDRTNPDRFEEAKKFYLQHKDEMDKGADILWKKGETLYDLMCEYYGEGKQQFLLERQNEILEDIDRAFRIEEYRFIEDTEEFLKDNWATLVFYAYVDPTIGEKKVHGRSTPTLFSITVLAKAYENGSKIYYVVENISKVCRQTEQFEIIASIAEKFPLSRLYVETTGGQIFYLNALKSYFRERGLRPIPRAAKVMATKEKDIRIRSLEPYLANGTIVLNRKTAELNMEIMEYPNCTYNDALDSLAGCFLNCHTTFVPKFYCPSEPTEMDRIKQVLEEN